MSTVHSLDLFRSEIAAQGGNRRAIAAVESQWRRRGWTVDIGADPMQSAGGIIAGYTLGGAAGSIGGAIAGYKFAHTIGAVVGFLVGGTVGSVVGLAIAAAVVGKSTADATATMKGRERAEEYFKQGGWTDVPAARLIYKDDPANPRANPYIVRGYDGGMSNLLTKAQVDKEIADETIAAKKKA